MLLYYQVISTFDQLIAADLGFFGDIHSEGYPSFDWLGTDFASFGPEETARLPLVKQEAEETDMKKFSKKIMKVNIYHSCKVNCIFRKPQFALTKKKYFRVKNPQNLKQLQ